MTLWAINNSGSQVRAKNVKKKRDTLYKCKFCKEQVIFVDAILKAKHFRHLVESDCEPEPETEEHVYYKELVAHQLEKLDIGNVHLEYQLNDFRTDVFLQRNDNKDIAFEIQATNINFRKYEEKIFDYINNGYLVVYIFTGKDFLKQIRTNIFSLKEIEKRIFFHKSYKSSVIGSYIKDDKIDIPRFKQKYSKGNNGLCTSRFIIDKHQTKRYDLHTFLKKVDHYIIRNPFIPPCNHNDKRYEKNYGKIIRYKIICNRCNKFLGWLKNKKAKKIGLHI